MVYQYFKLHYNTFYSQDLFSDSFIKENNLIHLLITKEGIINFSAFISVCVSSNHMSQRNIENVFLIICRQFLYIHLRCLLDSSASEALNNTHQDNHLIF